jgi:ribose-phosphate pyrophosphokinase
MILNLDKSFKPLGENTVSYEAFTFSGGEPHIKITSDVNELNEITITHRLNSFNDLGLLCVCVDALKRMGVEFISLFIPYFPAARQDRVMIGGEALTVKVYADILNAMQLDKIIVFDAHSEVTPAVLDRCIVISNHGFIRQVLADLKKGTLLISPDGGALKKIYKVSQALGGAEVIECSKSRNVKTGALSGFKVYADDLEGKDCLIVDDICDGGATFIGLAEALKNKNAGNLYLAISHGIFSKGVEALASTFKKVYTTDSIKELKHEQVKQIQFSNGLLS